MLRMMTRFCVADERIMATGILCIIYSLVQLLPVKGQLGADVN